jgi:hypothetical protein
VHRESNGNPDDAASVLRRLELDQDRIIAYLGKTKYPSRRRLEVVASILDISLAEMTPAVDALERAGRVKVNYWKGSLVLTPVTTRGPKASSTI